MMFWSMLWKEWKWFLIGWPLFILAVVVLMSSLEVWSGLADKRRNCVDAGGAFIQGKCVQTLEVSP